MSVIKKNIETNSPVAKFNTRHLPVEVTHAHTFHPPIIALKVSFYICEFEKRNSILTNSLSNAHINVNCLLADQEARRMGNI
jgi:hypothetical protein